MVKKRKDYPDSAKASGPDHIPLGAPRNCKIELSCILADFFQYVPERILFYRLLVILIFDPRV